MLNSKQKGNIGLGLAIAYFSKQGYTISIPLTDSQDYDLVVDIDGFLNRVQVKYTAQKLASGSYTIGLRSISGSSKQSYKTVVETDIEYLFIVTELFDCYLIPLIDITAVSQLTITADIVKNYKV